MALISGEMVLKDIFNKPINDGYEQYALADSVIGNAKPLKTTCTLTEQEFDTAPIKVSKSLKYIIQSGECRGPKTAEGKQRIAQAQLKHGFYSKAGIEAKHAEAIQLRQLEDIAFLTGLIHGPRTRGCKPQGYRPITSFEAVKALIALD